MYVRMPSFAPDFEVGSIEFSRKLSGDCWLFKASLAYRRLLRTKFAPRAWGDSDWNVHA